jgi:hypothetical protein
MLTMLYTTAIRVSELIKIRGEDISLTHPKSITIRGKGRKVRIVPIVKPLAKLLETYLKENRCLHPTNINECIFLSHTKEPFSRQGVNYMIKKYADKARLITPSLIPDDCSPHKIRHSCAMALLEEGVDLNLITEKPKGQRGRPKRGLIRALIDRLREYKGEVCRFADDPLVPFTNNQAERDLRMVKVKNKVIGTFRSVHGAKDFLILKSLTSTASKVGTTAFDALLSLIFGRFGLVD